MHKTTIASVAFVLASLTLAAQGPVRTPEQAFGFRPGTDRQLVGWSQVVSYLTDVSRSSDRIRIIQMGTTTMGRPMVAAVVSSPANLARLDEYRQAIDRLADPRATPESAVPELVANGRTIVAIGCSVHASELGAAQMAPELVHYLTTDSSAETARILDNVILLLIPSLNPDGMDMVVDWYRQSVGKPWEGSEMPALYNKYTGHDINRDFFMFTQQENRLLASLLYSWHPQVYLSMHQMGTTGPRIFVPPLVDPIDPNYEPLIWPEMGLLGEAMALSMEAKGMKGVITNAMYDYYIPGYDDSGPLGHNTVCLLSEVASARLATPVTVRKEELRGGSKGLPEYAVQQNFPDPWMGGTWRLSDIVQYDKQAALGLLGAAARYREDLLRNFYMMGRNQVEKGKAGGPYAFVVPAAQRDPLTADKMIDILRIGAVEVWRAKNAFQADGKSYAAGSYVVKMDQPFRAYAKTLLEKQVYPVPKTAPGAPAERPYDVTGWTLPYQMGVETVAVNSQFAFDGEPVDRASHAATPVNLRGAALVVPSELNDSFTLVNKVLKDGGRVLRSTSDGSFLFPIDKRTSAKVAEYFKTLPIPTRTLAKVPSAGVVQVRQPRVGLYRPWSANADEGWTRWLLEQYEFKFETIRDADIRAGKLLDRFDVVVLPSLRAQSFIDGNRAGTTSPEYAGGVGNEGIANLKQFMEGGGVLVALGQSSRLAIDRFQLPVGDGLQGVTGFYCPGSILRTAVDTSSPVAYGMPAESIAVFQSSPVFDVPTTADGASGPHAIVRYAADGVLMSGWAQGEKQIANKAAAVDVPVGRGRAILFGFGVQNRAQPHATFKLLFNALLLGGTK